MSYQRYKFINKKSKGPVVLETLFTPPTEAEKEVAYPDSKNLKINQSDLKLELIHFAKANEQKPNLSLFLGIASIWITIFTADFRAFLWVSANDLQIIVICLAFFSTVLSLKSVLIMFYRFVVAVAFFRKLFNADGWIHKNEIDPEKKAESIIKKCELK
jgi:hypothetical protein